MATDEITGDDILDVRDIIARVEDLRAQRDDVNPEDDMSYELDTNEKIELAALESLLEDLCGHGGDEQWEGNWYPLTLIRDSYFVEAMQELVQDIGDLPRGIPPYIAIDWEKTADNLRVDYGSVEFDGDTYWYR